MTSLTMTADAPVFPTSIPARPITFVATGTGGIPPYEYQYARGYTFILRDWSPDARFIWDPIQQPPSSGFVSITAFARSSGRRNAEVTKTMEFSVKWSCQDLVETSPPLWVVCRLELLGT
jgi:hypothetical protein